MSLNVYLPIGFAVSSAFVIVQCKPLIRIIFSESRKIVILRKDQALNL